MDLTMFLLGQLIVVLIAIGLVSAIVFALRYAFQKLRIKKYKREELVRLYIMVIALWLAILATLSFQGFFEDFQAFPPRMLVCILPPLILTVVLLFSRMFKFILLVIPFSWLVYVQSFRILVELFLWIGYLGGYVPPQMTFEWLNFDIIAGLSALVAGQVFFGFGRFRRNEAILWNIFGIMLLVNVLIISIYSTPSPFQVFFIEPENRFIAYFPFIWIPGFFVPFALSMHIFSLKQLILAKPGKVRFRFNR